ncbi:MAG: hypothetical protein ACRYFY_14770, partial [Janthinobacterium lividum]
MISPTLRKLHTETEVTEDGAEARMRQALGQLGSAKLGKPDAPRRSTTYQATPGAGRHRFKQDGEVPVVRISLAQGCRATERQAQALVGSTRTRQGPLDEGREHGNGETARQVQELTEQLRVTQTRLGHAELALTEADRKAEVRQEEAASLRQD